MAATYTSTVGKTPRRWQPPVGSGSSRLTLRMNFLWTLGGNLVYAASQWGILTALAKLGTPQMVGEFALALAITAPIVIGTGLHLRSIQATDAAGEYYFGDYLSLRLITSVIACVLIAGVTRFSGHTWHTAATVLIVGVAKGFESISDIFYGLLQQHERMDRIALSMMIRGLLSLAMVACAIYLSGDLLFGVSGLAAVWALVLLAYDVRTGVSALRGKVKAADGTPEFSAGLARRLQLHWRPRALMTLTSLALPVGIVMALLSFNANIPRYFIERHLGTGELGIFAALAYPMAAGAMVVNALGQSATPRLARHYADGDYRAFSSLLRKLLCLGAAVGAAGTLLIWLAGRPILLLLYRPEYAERVGTFLWLGIAAGISYVASLLGYGMTAARYLRIQLPLNVACTLVTAMGCALLVAPYQLSGAVMAISLASMCQALGSIAVIVHAVRKRRVA